MNKLILFLFSIPLAVGCLAYGAGSDRNLTVDPVYTQGGNNVWERVVSPTVGSLAVLSTPTANANLGTLDPYRVIHIVNLSTHAAMCVFPSANYTQYSSTAGIHLSSFTLSSDANQFTTNYQGKLYGVWDTNGTLGTAGAYVWIEYTK